MTMETPGGRHIKREYLRAKALSKLVWVDGDDDVPAGVRLLAGDGTTLFVPADFFDTVAFWTHILERNPTLPRSGRGITPSEAA